MNTGTLLRRFASDEDLSPLLKERELRFLKARPADSVLTKGDIAAVIMLCDRVLAVLDTDERTLDSYEQELDMLAREMQEVTN